MKIKMHLLIIFCCVCTPLSAEEIHFKDGNIIDCDIIRETPEAVIYQFYDSSQKEAAVRDNVIKIKYSSGKEIQLSDAEANEEIASIDIGAKSENKAKKTMAFSNSISFRNISTKLDFDTRKTDTIINDNTMYFEEYFKTYFYPICIIWKDTPLIDFIINKLFCGLNINLAYDENSTKKYGIELQCGYGEPDRIFMCGQIGVSIQKDLIYNKVSGNRDILGFQIGYSDDIHFYVRTTNMLSGISDDTGRPDPLMSELYVDSSLGWKNFLPFFIKINILATETEQVLSTPSGCNIYNFAAGTLFFHLQYINERYDLSLGYTYYEQDYSITKYDNDYISTDYSVLKEEKYFGGGLTASVKNIFTANNSLFGEFHLLADKNASFITICRFGLKTLF